MKNRSPLGCTDHFKNSWFEKPDRQKSGEKGHKEGDGRKNQLHLLDMDKEKKER